MRFRIKVFPLIPQRGGRTVSVGLLQSSRRNCSLLPPPNRTREVHPSHPPGGRGVTIHESMRDESLRGIPINHKITFFQQREVCPAVDPYRISMSNDRHHRPPLRAEDYCLPYKSCPAQGQDRSEDCRASPGGFHGRIPIGPRYGIGKLYSSHR
jgi:hypothetical protein